MNKELKRNRLPLMISDREVAAIDEYRWQERIPSQAEAVRRLIAKGLESEMETAPGGEIAAKTPDAVQS